MVQLYPPEVEPVSHYSRQGLEKLMATLIGNLETQIHGGFLCVLVASPLHLSQIFGIHNTHSTGMGCSGGLLIIPDAFTMAHCGHDLQ